MTSARSSQELLATIEQRDRRMKLWIRIVIVAAFVAMSCLLLLAWRDHNDNLKAQAAQQRLAQQQSKTLSKLDTQAQQRDKNLQKLIDDNAKQTIILCSLIIQNSQDLTDQEAIDVQTICRQEIQKATDQFNASNNNATTPSSASQGSSSGGASSPNSAPSNGNTQANNPPQQPEPVRVLGVPVCVPLTGVCVRQ